MTGYGEKTGSLENTEVLVQIKTLNHRFLQVNITCLEDIPWRWKEQIEKKIKGKIHRGKIMVNLQISQRIPESIEIEPNFEIAKSYFGALKKLQKKLNLKESIELPHLLNFPEILKTGKKKLPNIEKILQQTIDETLNQVVKSRTDEGEKHLKEILNYAKKIKFYISCIKKEFPSAQKKYREKLQEEIEKISSQEESLFSSNQINSKMAFMASKGDITEEIVRFNFHIAEFGKILRQRKAIGKKLGFILQELQREITTIGAKSLSYGISNQVIKIKDNIEKIREQIYNIE